MKTKSTNIIGKADGPTSYFVLLRDKKLTMKQRMQKVRFQLKKKWVEKHISSGAHTMDEVCQYIQKQYDFREVMGEQAGVQYEEEIREFMEQIEARKEIAKKVPKEKFDIDFHKFEKKMGDNEMHIIIEKKYEHIGGGASGKKTIKKFHKIFKDIYRYYGVTQEDIDQKTKRYETLIRRLAVK